MLTDYVRRAKSLIFQQNRFQLTPGWKRGNTREILRCSATASQAPDPERFDRHSSQNYRFGSQRVDIERFEPLWCLRSRRLNIAHHLATVPPASTSGQPMNTLPAHRLGRVTLSMLYQLVRGRRCHDAPERPPQLIGDPGEGITPGRTSLFPLSLCSPIGS